MSNDLTYSLLPEWLSLPLADKVISQQEAVALWDQWLLLPPNQERFLPDSLQPACHRMRLWALPVQSRVQ